jgi:chromosome segregation ATPase
MKMKKQNKNKSQYPDISKMRKEITEFIQSLEQLKMIDLMTIVITINAELEKIFDKYNVEVSVLENRVESFRDFMKL